MSQGDLHRPGPRELLDSFLARHAIDELVQAARHAFLGDGGEELLDTLDNDITTLVRHVQQLEEHIYNLNAKVAAVLEKPRWTIHIGRTGITITRGAVDERPRRCG